MECQNCSNRVSPVRNRFLLYSFLWIGVVALIIFLAVLNSPRLVAERFYEAFVEADCEKMLKYLPEDVRRVYMGEDDEAQKEWAETASQSQKDLFERLNVNNEDWHLEYKVEEIEKMDQADFDELQEHYQETYDCRINAARVITLEEVTHANGKESSRECTVYVIRIGLRWYMEWESYKGLR